MGYSFLNKAEIRMMTGLSNFGEVFLFPFLYQKHEGIDKQQNLRYQQTGKRTKLDIYSKRDKSEKKPLFVYIHGGGWVSGLRVMRRFYCYNWVEQGYVAANIGYDYGVDAKHPEHIQEIFKGIEYVLDRADEYGIDKNKVVVAGESAGGYFAALIGAVTSHHELYSSLGIRFAYQDSFKVSALVLISGIYHPEKSIATKFPQMALYVRALSGMSQKELRAHFGDEFDKIIAPEYYADSAFPPSFVIGSDKDKLLAEAKDLYNILLARHVPVELYVCTGLHGVHAGALACDRMYVGKECVQRAQKFAAEQLKQPIASK